MTERIRIYYYVRPGAVNAWAVVKGQRVDMKNCESIEDAKKRLMDKATRILNENADQVEDVDVEF